MKKFRWFGLCSWVLFLGATVTCFEGFKGGDQEGGGGENAYNTDFGKFGDCQDCQGFDFATVSLAADGLKGLVTIDEESGATEGGIFKKQAGRKSKDRSVNSLRGLFRNSDKLTSVVQSKINRVGREEQAEATQEEEALAGEGETKEEEERPWEQFGVIPPVTRIAANPIPGTTNEWRFYLIFEHCYMFSDPRSSSDEIKPGMDPWHCANPWTCQIFTTTGDLDKTYDNIETQNLAFKSLECVNPYLEYNTWDTSERNTLQFDGSGNFYFVGRYAENNEEALFKYNPNDKSTEEIVGPQVNLNTWTVNKDQSIMMKYHSERGGGARLLRFDNNSYNVVQISTEDSWSVRAIQDLLDSNDLILFSPTTLTGARDWHRCFWTFHTDIEDDKSTVDKDERAEELTACFTDMWQEMNEIERGTATEPMEVKTICEKEGYFSGNDAWQIIQSSSGNIFYIGEVRKRLKGDFTCSGNFRDTSKLQKGSDNREGWCSTGDLTLNETNCKSKGGVWSTDLWFNNIDIDNICDLTKQTTITRDVWTSCQLGGSDSQTYTMLAKIDRKTGAVTPLTDTTEQALSAIMALIDISGTSTEVLIANTYNTGTYSIKKIDPNNTASVCTLTKGFEVYSYDVIDNKLVFDGLYLANNNYGLYTIDFSKLTDAKCAADGLTYDEIGKIDIDGSVRTIYGLGKIRTNY